MRDLFWHAENQLQARLNDPQRDEDSRAASAADEYLKLASADKLPVAPAMLYLGGLARYSV